MSTMAVVDDQGTLTGADQLTKEVRDAIAAARDDRKRFEPSWHMSIAFAAGKYWLAWDQSRRTLVFPEELFNKELYSTDVITEYRTTALGELSSDDDRPQLLLRRDDQPSEDFAEQLNRAVAYGWDNEWMGDQVLEEVRRLCIDLGTVGVRCRFDPTVGPLVADNVPYTNGKPVLDTSQATDLFANGPNPNVQMGGIRQGRIVWETLSPFNLIVPPGFPHEKDFPWECVVRPVLLSKVQAEYGEITSELKADGDIVSTLGFEQQGEGTGAMAMATGKASTMKGHVWLFTYYERPNPKFPDGRTVIFATNKMKPIHFEAGLPYKEANGSPCSGIAYFHWWRTTGRFWSRSLVEAMKDPQRIVNKRRTQINEIIDRGLPVVFVSRNSPAKERKGLPLELIEIGENERAPQPTPGVNPGEWMYHDIQEMREDLEHATGIRGPRLGENPVNVTTYAQLALLNENDQVKRQTILREHKQSIAKLVESTIYDIRTYWGPQKEIMLAGEEDSVDASIFNATSIPPFFIVKVAKGATQPRTQAAELKKIEDIWAASIASMAYVSNPHDWVDWLKESLDQGQALELPEGGVDTHADKAALENHLMVAGQAPPVQYYDPAEVHIPIHREEQIRAELNGNVQLWQLIENHVQQHVLMAQSVAQHLAQMAPTPSPMQGDPNAPQGPGQAGPAQGPAQGQGAPPGQ